MDSFQKKNNRAENLLQRFFDHELSEEESLELLVIWQEEPDLEKSAWANVQTEALLQFFAKLEKNPITYHPAGYYPILLKEQSLLFQEEHAGFELSNLDQLARLAALSPPLPKMESKEDREFKPLSKTASPQYGRTPEKPSRLLYFAVSVILVLFFSAVYFEFRPESENVGSSMASIPSFARVSRVANVIFSEDAPVFREGRSIGNEEIRLISGLMELELESGVRIVLEGPVTFHLQSAMKTFCERGRVSVEVPERAVGFETLTPFINVRDLGTEFVVDVGEKESTVHVITGKVEMEKLSGDWFPIPEGIGRVVDVMKVEKQIVSNKKLYTDRNTMFHAAELWDRKCQDVRRERDDRWNVDPDLRLWLDFEDRRGERINGVRIVTGRLRNEKAVEFRRKNDFIQTELRGEHRKLTLMASVWIDNLDRSCNTIMATDQYLDRPGFCWLIDERGRLRLRVLREIGQKAQSYDSDSCFNTSMFGCWVDLAVTIDMDRREVVHYVDGIPVSTNAIKDVFPIDLGNPTVGNWIRDLRTPTDRHLDGRIASVFVFSRVLSPDEIRQQTFEHRSPPLAF